MATKEHAGIRKLAESLLEAQGWTRDLEMWNFQLPKTQAELSRALGPLLESSARVCNWIGDDSRDCHAAHKRLAAALERFNRGE